MIQNINKLLFPAQYHVLWISSDAEYKQLLRPSATSTGGTL